MLRITTLTVLASVSLGAQSPESQDLFEKKIRPVLSTKCYGCHSGDSGKPMSGLRLDTREGIRKGGSSGLPAVTPKNLEHSLILSALKQDGPLKMPPGGKLSDDVVSDFEAWIKLGAPDPREGKIEAPTPAYDYEKARRHWCYQPVHDPLPPPMSVPSWARNAIDRFIKSELDKRQLKPAILADRRALIRRATFDLTGLPPAPVDVDAFVKDNSMDAFAKVVDRLLATRQYAERWGRHWLDVVRYADTAGCNSDFPIPDAYRYRDWVISAFEKDKPYNDFLREQLAGDLLPAKNDEDHQAKVIATGYIAISRRFASNPNEHYLTIDDTVDNVGKAMLGLSISCARCHDHKFDPIPESDYFGMYGIFQSTVYPFAGLESIPRPYDNIALGSPEQQAVFNAWQDKLKSTYLTMRELKFGPGAQKPGSKEEYARLKKEILVVETNVPDVPKAYAVKEGEPVNAKIMFKGDPRKLGAATPRGWLTILGGEKLPAGAKGSGRGELADWITDPRNPLTARVMVNRIWEWHFGKGVVTTPNDFGVRGEAPSNPQLLDWLTSRFVESGYSIKAMNRLIMLTRVYQLSSDYNNEANFRTDPKNAYQWHFDRRRLEAEEIRDAMLALSGDLDLSPGGPHPFPPIHQWNYTQHRQFYAVYDHNKRSVYLMQPRLHRPPLLELFDPADPNASTGVRSASITALQALALMNSEFVHKQADQFAQRIDAARKDTPGRISLAHELAFSRPPSSAELTRGAAYLDHAAHLLKDADFSPEQQSHASLASYLRLLLSSDEMFFID